LFVFKLELLYVLEFEILFVLAE